MHENKRLEAEETPDSAWSGTEGQMELEDHDCKEGFSYTVIHKFER